MEQVTISRVESGNAWWSSGQDSGFSMQALQCPVTGSQGTKILKAGQHSQKS